MMGRACRPSRIPRPFPPLPRVPLSTLRFFWLRSSARAFFDESRVALRVQGIKRRFLVPASISSREYKLATRTEVGRASGKAYERTNDDA